MACQVALKLSQSMVMITMMWQKFYGASSEVGQAVAALRCEYSRALGDASAFLEIFSADEILQTAAAPPKDSGVDVPPSVQGTAGGNVQAKS